MLFTYRAKDQTGVIKKGAVEATTEAQASEILHGHGLTVMHLEQEEVSISFEKFIPFLGKVPRKELVLFSRQLSTLINAKVPIISALDILIDQVTSKKLKEIINEMMDDIEGGKSLSESVARFPEVFSNLYMNLIKSGELSGTLDSSLLYIADQQERDYELMSKVKGAMTYPIFIISAIFIVGALMFIFVLPQLIGVLREAGAQLPLTTRILIFLTDTLKQYWLWMILLIIGGVAGLRFYLRTVGGRFVWDTIKLRLPIMGKLLKIVYMDRFARNLSTLIAGGIPIVQSLNTVANIVSNTVYRKIIMDAALEVEAGKSIATVFERHTEIPKILTQMIRIGEQTGSLDQILGKLASFYDKEVDNMLRTLTTLMEPVIMILLGLAVAVMVAGILLPIYNLASIQ